MTVAHKGCPYADRQASPNSIHCSILRGNGAKWDFCINQRFCRVSGNYELTGASDCRVAKSKKED